MNRPRILSLPRRVLLPVLAVLLVAVACSDDSSSPFEPTTTLPMAEGLELDAPEAGLIVLPPDFQIPDTRGAALPYFPSDPEEIDEKLPVQDERRGKARLSGIVTFEGRRVGGARVRLERIVGNRIGVLDVAANGEGVFTVKELLGGKYRIRAWETPALSAVPSQTLFLPAAADVDLEVPLTEFDGQRLQGALTTGEPRVGATVTLRALLTEVEVDGEGYVNGTGLPNETITVSTGEGYRPAGPTTATTDASGYATFSVVCLREGAHQVTLRFLELTVTATLPVCLPPSADATTTTSTTEPEADDDPDGSSTTTTTTPPSFPVGEEFTTPYGGPLPPGTYTSADSGPCRVVYEVYNGREWRAAVAPASGATMVLTFPARRLQPASGTTPCTYRRTA